MIRVSILLCIVPLGILSTGSKVLLNHKSHKLCNAGGKLTDSLSLEKNCSHAGCDLRSFPSSGGRVLGQPLYRTLPPLLLRGGEGRGICAQASLRAVTLSYWPCFLYSFLSISPANTAVQWREARRDEGDVREPTLLLCCSKRVGNVTPAAVVYCDRHNFGRRTKLQIACRAGVF